MMGVGGEMDVTPAGRMEVQKQEGSNVSDDGAGKNSSPITAGDVTCSTVSGEPGPLTTRIHRAH